jgi:hypothetical protein
MMDGVCKRVWSCVCGVCAIKGAGWPSRVLPDEDPDRPGSVPGLWRRPQRRRCIPLAHIKGLLQTPKAADDQNLNREETAQVKVVISDPEMSIRARRRSMCRLREFRRIKVEL